MSFQVAKQSDALMDTEETKNKSPQNVDYFELKVIKTQETQENLLSPLNYLEEFR